MHIKNIIISGFRSYRDQAFQEELSPRHNVIVGRNGSGKSNFFAAVQFVLSEKFANLRAEERKELFHVGAGRPALAVFVEIVFDNADGRLVIPGRPDESEIRIRRTVGLKQDEFRVNDRRFTAAEVRQLLESAGFSASNPYYIVEQGKIVNLASMKESERYQLIKDVAGTKVYESRRLESEALLQESSGRFSKIDESIKQLEARLALLEAETTELRAFQEADRQRKALEFCVYNAELAAAKNELERMDSEWQARAAGGSTASASLQETEEQVRSEERLLASAAKRLETLEAERKVLERERTELVSRRALAQLRVEDAIAAAQKDSKEIKSLQSQESDLQKGLERTVKDSTSKQKTWKEMRAKVDAAAAELANAEGQLELLQTKRGRMTQFRSRAERDAWITAEVKRNEDLVASNTAEIARLESEAKKIEDELKRDARIEKEQAKSIEVAEATIAGTETSRAKWISERDRLNTERRKLWALAQEHEGSVKRLSSELDGLRNALDKATRLDIRQGLQSVEECLAEIGDKKLAAGVHGQILELIRVDRGFENAVEITAGNAIFNIVVDSFDISSRILDHMNKKRKAGRVTFFPLDTCKSLPKDIPTTPTCSPLLSHIQYDKKFASVCAEMFGKTAVVQTLEAGAAAVKELDVDAVTLDGDQFSRKGGITGGHFDRRSTRIVSFHDMVATKEKLRKEKEALSRVCQEVADKEQAITTILQQLDQASSQQNATRDAADVARQDARSREDRRHRYEQLQQNTTQSIETLQRSNASIQRTLGSLQAELRKDFSYTLTTAEEAELERLQQFVSRERGTVAAMQAKLVQLTTESELLKEQLRYFESNLAAVRDRLSVLGRTTGPDASAAKEVASLDAEQAVVDERLALIDQAVEKTALERRQHEERIAGLRAQLLQVTRLHQDEKEALDRSHNQRVLLLQRKDDAQAKIRKLGVIPQISEKYASLALGKLMHLLKGAQEELKKFAHVNKKAVDQYTALVETRNELHQQQQTLEKELKSIHDLMKHLDEKKEEAIHRTYKQVQFNFETVFAELVQAEGAMAELQLVKNADRTAADPYSAVRVKVSFGVGSAVTELAQLSGGQKSLVALALIFSIQRCDPAPFYLFDEIDAALDAEYRTAVANVIRKQSDSCQFITATFKMEMLEAADKVLGIFFHNKVSRIQPISLEDGRRLLKQAAMDERKRDRDAAEAQEA